MAASAAESAAATLTFATGRASDLDVRMIAGEVNGEGVLYAEYYTDGKQKLVAPFDRVFVEDEKTSPRELHDIVLSPTQTRDGFAFTATRNGEALQCTALLWSDHSASCTRVNGGWIPPGEAPCIAAFAGHDARQQCNGIRAAYPAGPHDELLRTCTSSFRQELIRNECMMYGYSRPALFAGALPACMGAFRTEDERKFCLFAAIAPVNPAERVPPSMIRTCGQRGGTEREISDCMFELLTGAKQEHPRSKPDPSQVMTERVVITVPPTSTVRGGTLASSKARIDDLPMRAIGGMVGTEPVLFVDAFDAEGALKWTNNVDRVVIGGHIRALREATGLDGVALRGGETVFRIVLGGASHQCRGKAGTTFARCR